MRTLPACAFVALTSLAAACGGGGDAKPDAPPIVIPDAAPDAPPPPPDAPALDLSCMGNPAPGTAPATITISGTATDINILAQQLEPVADASVKATKNPAVPVGPQNVKSDAQGNWTLSDVPTATVPLDGFVEAAKTGHRTTRVYPPQPLNADLVNVPVPLLSDGTFSFVVQFAGANQADENGTVGLVVLDCANTPVAGATVSVTQNGTEVGTVFDASQLQDGTFLVFDVPPGDTVVNATAQGTTFRAHTIGVAAKTTSGTIVTPGFAN